MPHSRKRYAKARLEAALRSSPIVGLLGHRQTGKTTLLSALSAKRVSLDQRLERELLERDPGKYLSERSAQPLALDECQWAPDLFPALKEAVRLKARPGQYLLSGSVRFTSRKAIRESLAGRLLLVELHPMGLREILGEPLSRLPIELLEAKNFSGFALPGSTPEVIHREYLKQLERYRRLGGLPGICLQREDVDRTSRHMDLLDLMLDRDLRIILETPLSLSRIHAVLAAIADANGTPLKFVDIQRKSKVSTPTLRKLLTAFEALFLIRTLRLEGGRSAPVVWFEDAGEWSRITGRPSSLDHFLFCQVRLAFSCAEGKRAEYFQYATRGGAAIPVCVRTTAGVLGIMAVAAGELSRSQILSAESFLKHYADSKVLFVHLGREWRRVSDRILMVPISAF